MTTKTGISETQTAENKTQEADKGLGSSTGSGCRTKSPTSPAFAENGGSEPLSSINRQSECPSAATGRRGEETATEWLRHEGYEICDRNWRSGPYELDLVARRQGSLHFVEVKTRKADGLTAPEQALTPGKCRALIHAANRYIALHGSAEDPRIDLIAVDMLPDGTTTVRFIPDAIESHW